MLNKVLRITGTALLYEADPRDGELRARSLGLEDCKCIPTPGVKWRDDGDASDGPNGEDNLDDTDVTLVAPLIRRPRWRIARRTNADGLDYSVRQKVRFVKTPHVHEIVEPYSLLFGCHPRTFVFHGPVGNARLVKVQH